VQGSETDSFIESSDYTKAIVMKTRRRLLEKIEIASACSADWESMSGDERVRFCDQCNKQVYNISRMTRTQAEQLLANSVGKLCARIERHPNGTVITESERMQISLFSRISSPVASAVIATTLSLSANASTPISPQTDHFVFQSASKSSAQSEQASSARLRITIFDVNRAVIVGAKVSVTNESTGATETAVSSAAGECTFSLLDAGSYKIRIEAMGFTSFKKEGFVLQAGSVIHFGPTLEVGATMGEVIFVGEIEPTPFPKALLELFKKPKKNT